MRSMATEGWGRACRGAGSFGLGAGIGVLCPGCTSRAAPTWSLFGAYFPVWLPCALIGMAAALAAWRAMLLLPPAPAIPARRLACCAVGLIAGCLAWWLWGR